MDEKIRRLEKWRKGKEAPPYLIDINPTNQCNLNCKSCWQRNPKFKDMDYSDELSDEVIIRVVDEAIEMGARRFDITGGGEPMSRKELVIEVMEMIKKAGIQGNITTNGTLFDMRDLKKIKKMGWDSVTFSLDGPDKKTNDFLRGEGSFKSILDSLRYLSKSSGMNKKPEIKFNTVISNKNYNKLKEMITLASKFNVKNVNFETMTVHSKQSKELKLDEKEEKEFLSSIETVEKIAKKHNVETNISGLKKEYFQRTNKMNKILKKKDGGRFSDIACYEPWYHIVIKVDGSVQPCCLYDLKKENVKDRSLEKIWFGETFSKIRSSITKGDLSDFCEICNASQVIANEKIAEEVGPP